MTNLESSHVDTEMASTAVSDASGRSKMNAKELTEPVERAGKLDDGKP